MAVLQALIPEEEPLATDIRRQPLSVELDGARDAQAVETTTLDAACPTILGRWVSNAALSLRGFNHSGASVATSTSYHTKGVAFCPSAQVQMSGSTERVRPVICPVPLVCARLRLLTDRQTINPLFARLHLSDG